MQAIMSDCEPYYSFRALSVFTTVMVYLERQKTVRFTLPDKLKCIKDFARGDPAVWPFPGRRAGETSVV